MNASLKPTVLALDAVLSPKPLEYGLHEDNSAEGTYIRAMEDYGWAVTFTYECGRDGFEITYAELCGRGSSIVVPLSFFTASDLDMVADEIRCELNEKHATEADDPGSRGDFEYEARRDRA